MESKDCNSGNQSPYNGKHNLRKQLKLLMLSNMKMKKQVRTSQAVRRLNTSRLQEEILTLNNVVYQLTKHIMGEEHVGNINIEHFTNPNKICDKSSVLSTTKKNLDYKFFCDKCSFKCRKRTPFDIHMRRHENLRLYQCDECSKTFITPAELKMHKQKHDKGKQYACDQCSYSTHNAHLLVTHKEKSHFISKLYSCSACSFSTKNRLEWKEHVEAFPIHRVVSHCSACMILRQGMNSGTQTLNRTAEGVSKIEDTRHTCGKRWSCHNCGLLFMRHDSLKKHTTSRHSSQRRYQCDLCEYSAVTKHSLTIHIRTHSGEKPFQCTECPFSCTTRSYLTIHLNIHKGIKPYQCDLCTFRSADSSKISVHKKRIHPSSDEANNPNILNKNKKKIVTISSRFMCKHCGRMFHTLGALTHHEKEHIIEEDED